MSPEHSTLKDLPTNTITKYPVVISQLQLKQNESQ